MLSYETVKNIIFQVVLQAKDIIIEVKDLSFDIVTEYDRKVEETLIKKIRAKYPNHK